MTWMNTMSGRRHDLLAPEKNPVDWDEVAHALSHVNRFCGHTDYSYSVAQHCCLVSDFLPPEYRLHGLLHDAPEAFLNDETTPSQAAREAVAVEIGIEMGVPAAQMLGKIVKEARKRLHQRHDDWLFAAAGIDPTDASYRAVKAVDRVLFNTELRDLTPAGDKGDFYLVEEFRSYGALPNHIRPWPAARAKSEWLRRLRVLMRGA